MKASAGSFVTATAAAILLFHSIMEINETLFWIQSEKRA